MLYEYNGITVRPNIDQRDYRGIRVWGILLWITNSLMTSKDIRSIKRNDVDTLLVYWWGELSTDDKTLLDGIINSNLTYISDEDWETLWEVQMLIISMLNL